MKTGVIAVLWMLLFSIHAVNVIPNPTFADSMKGWRLTQWTKIFGALQAEDGVLTLRNTDLKQVTMAECGVKLLPDTVYTLKFRMKGSDIYTDGGKGSGASVMILHKGKMLFECSPAGKWRMTSGSFDWKDCTFTFKTEKIDGYSTCYLVLRKSTGSVMFKDPVLEAESVEPVKSTGGVSLIPVCWQKNEWNLAGTFPGTLYCDIRTTPPKTGALELEFTLPPGIQLVAASPWHLYDSGLKGDAILRNGNVSRIRLNPKFVSSLKPDSRAWNNFYRVFVASDGKTSGGQAVMRLLADGRQIIPEQKFQIRVLPELPRSTDKLKNFGLLITYLYNLNAPTAELRNAYLNFWLGVAEKPETFTSFSFDRLPEEVRKEVKEKFRCSIFVGTRYSTPLGDFSGWQKKSGKTIPKIQMLNGGMLEWACPSYLTGRDTPFWNEYVSEMLARRVKKFSAAARIVWDIEPGAKEYCYCDECRRNFSAFLRLDHLPSAGEIQKKHGASWFRFRVEQNAKIINNFADLCRKKFPSHELVLCTDPLHAAFPHVQEWCGVDVRLSDKSFDLFMNMPYYQGVRWYDDLAFNRKQLKTPNYPLIDPSEMMEMFYKRYTPRGVMMNMVASAALGGRGIGFWPGDNFDGAYLHSIASAAPLIARGEEYYAGERCDSAADVKPLNVTQLELSDQGRKTTVAIPDFSSVLRFTAHKNKNSYLVTVFNYHPSAELIARIGLPESRSASLRVRCLNDGKEYPAADSLNGILAEIPPESVRLYEFTSLPFVASGTVDTKKLEGKLASALARNSTVNSFQSCREGNAAVEWGFLPDGSRPMLKLRFGNRAVYLDPERSAAVVSYRIDDLEDILQGEGRGELDEFKLFLFPGNLTFALKEVKIEKGVPVALLTAHVPVPENADPDSVVPSGLQIEKRISLEESGRLIRSVYTLTNPKTNGRTVAAGFRLKNHPRLGAAWKTGKPLSSLWRIQMNGTPENILFSGSGKSDNLILASGIEKIPGGLSGEVFPSRYTGGFATLAAVSGRQKMSLGFELQPQKYAAGFLIWWSSSSASTLEPLSVDMSLRPGESREMVSRIFLQTP